MRFSTLCNQHTRNTDFVSTLVLPFCTTTSYHGDTDMTPLLHSCYALQLLLFLWAVLVLLCEANGKQEGIILEWGGWHPGCRETNSRSHVKCLWGNASEVPAMFWFFTEGSTGMLWAVLVLLKLELRISEWRKSTEGVILIEKKKHPNIIAHTFCVLCLVQGWKRMVAVMPSPAEVTVWTGGRKSHSQHRAFFFFSQGANSSADCDTHRLAGQHPSKHLTPEACREVYMVWKVIHSFVTPDHNPTVWSRSGLTVSRETVSLFYQEEFETRP